MNPVPGKEKRKRGGREFDPQRVSWRETICLESFGVKIGIRSNVGDYAARFFELLPEILPNGWRAAEESEVEFWFSIYKPSPRARLVEFYKNGELISARPFDASDTDFLISSLRLTIAEYAPRRVFLHAGVVEYKNRAIVIPGRSFSGKTTLVAALMKRGCRYYSDEYAVIDTGGMVEPYAKKLSLRGIIDDYRQVDFAAAELGGTTGIERIPVGVILLTQYEKFSKFKPRESTPGEGIIGMIANSISIRRDPQFVLRVLTKVANGARTIETKRGAADKFAARLLDFLEADGESPAGVT